MISNELQHIRARDELRREPKLDECHCNAIWVTSYLTLRRTIGVLSRACRLDILFWLGVVLMPSKYHKSDSRAVGWISQHHFSRGAARALMITAISRLVRLTDGVHFIFNLIFQVPLMLTHQYFYNSKNYFYAILMSYCYKCYVHQNKTDKSTSTF